MVPEHAPARRRRRWFWLLLAAIVVVVLELGGAAAWWWMTGAPFTWARADAARALVTGAPAPSESQDLQRERAVLRQLQGNVAQHPFLGYVGDADLAAQLGGVPVSRWGFLDTGPPLRRRGDDVFVVGITGGSVAAQTWDQARDVLIEELGRCRRVAGRRIELVNLAFGGYRQPQQLFALTMVLVLGGEFDLVINLDGFNEVGLVRENVPLGVPAWYPRGWARLLDQPSPAQQLRLGRLALAREQRQDLARAAGWWRWSALLQTGWLLADRTHERAIAAAATAVEEGASTRSYAVTGPGTDGITESAGRAQMASVWAQGSLAMATLCARHGAHYSHFLQPNQYVPGSKPMGDQELRVAFQPNNPLRRAVEDGYPLLLAQAGRLAAGGVVLHDLTRIFVEHPEPLYTDTCCHLGREGYAMLARRVAATVRAELDLAAIRFVQLRAEPHELTFATPLSVQAIAVSGIDERGDRVDVSDAGTGTRVQLPAGLLADLGLGRLRPLRRGHGRIRVEREGLSVDVPVQAAWPDVWIGDDQAAAAGSAPRLTVGPVAMDADVAVGGCAGLPAGGLRVLVTGVVPIPAAVPERASATQGLMLTPLPADGATLPVQVPWPRGAGPRDVPWFARVLVLDAEARTVLAASNTVVLTRS